MISTVDRDIERIENSLFAAIGDVTDQYLARKERLIEKNLKILQGQFFSILAQKIIGVMSAPNLGDYTPTWKPLPESYTRRRAKAGKGFYKFSGGLATSLRQSKALNAFGNPLIYTDTYGVSKTGKQYEINEGRAYRSSGTVVQKGKYEIRRTIAIDLYPNVDEDIDNLTGSDLGKYFSNKIAVKLTNYRGQEDRPILAQYMNWWLNVKAKQVVMKALNGK